MYISTEVGAAARTHFITPVISASSPGLVLQNGHGDSQLQRWSSLIGIITAIVGNILISFALNIQRYAHIRLHERDIRQREARRNASKQAYDGYGAAGTNGDHFTNEEYEADEEAPLRQSFHSGESQSSTSTDADKGHNRSSYLKSPYWWGGIILMTVGEAGNFLAYGFAPASIVSPLGVVALISNCIIAPIMLKEKFRMRDFWGVLVAVGGAVTVVLSAKQQERKFGPHEIWGAISTLEFEIYMAVTIFLIIVLMWASPRYGNKTILVDLGLVGLFGGYTALSTKGVASMLSSTLWRALTTPVTYALVLVLAGTAVMQIRYVNRALQRFDSTQVIPVQFVLFTLSVIIGSAILYRDFEKVNAENAVKFVGGCLLTFFGVWLITSGRPRHEDEDEEVEADAEQGQEHIGLAHQEGLSDEFAHQNGNQKQFNALESSRNSLMQTGDATLDGQSTKDSRRSSHVSFALSLSRPQTPQRVPSAPRQSMYHLMPSSTSDERPVSEDSPLLRNPWAESTDSLLRAPRHPGMPASTSSPVLPSEAQVSSSEATRPPATRSTTQTELHTHPSQQHRPTPPQAERPTTPAARHSISRMLPGPLLSPLSGGLSVVVADSIRRGVDSPIIRSSRRALRKTKSGSHRLSQAIDGTLDDDDADSPAKDGEASEQVSKSLGAETSTLSQRIRARSLSNTLGGLLRGKRSQSNNDDDVEGGANEGDDVAGPSGP
ncbi:DUF803 domain membrane protein [Rutstroemia sp. NJR-2017a WRK4]|nr:DUF803 domain membrane protein [Rutstroemia sp. NJR-2017a WRK4]